MKAEDVGLDPVKLVYFILVLFVKCTVVFLFTYAILLIIMLVCSLKICSIKFGLQN